MESRHCKKERECRQHLVNDMASVQPKVRLQFRLRMVTRTKKCIENEVRLRMIVIRRTVLKLQ